MDAKAIWKGEMEFETNSSGGHSITIDAKKEFGGEDKGTTPKELVLRGLAGCTAMDVIAILRKMRHEPKEFEVQVEAGMTEEHPKTFDGIHVHYIFKGDVPEDKARKAIELSQDKYCGVSAMLRKHTPITWDFEIKPA